MPASQRGCFILFCFHIPRLPVPSPLPSELPLYGLLLSLLLLLHPGKVRMVAVDEAVGEEPVFR